MSLKRLFQKRFGGKSGDSSQFGADSEMLHYRRYKDGLASRFHLRIDSNGEGVLLANAKSAVRLHPSGAIIAQCVLDGQSDDDVLKSLRKSFRKVNASQAREDVRKMRALIERMESPEAEFSLIALADPKFSPEASPLLRPLAADVPLGTASATEEILRRVWAEKIPHVTLICGENPEEKGLIRAVELAEDIGLITGVRGRGTDFAPTSRVEALAQAGLDHFDVFYASADDAQHDALFGPGDHAAALQAFNAARKLEVCPTAIIPLLRSTATAIDGLLATLSNAGVTNAVIFPLVSTETSTEANDVFHPDEVLHVFEMIEDAAVRHQVTLVWFPPTMFRREESIAVQVRRGPRTSGDFSVRIESDGRVFVSRGPRIAAGNILEDAWEKIADGEVYRNFRRRMELKKRCDLCPSLALCVADCFITTAATEE